MNKRVAGALILLILGIIAIVGAWYLLPYFRDAKQLATSDARRTKGKITVALDNWIGYFILRSPEMKKLMHRGGWVLAVEDDGADYARRMDRLKEGEIDFAVATVDSYILNAAGKGFPGTIIMVVDESKGGDAILARSDVVANLDALKGKSGVEIAFTPASPSHHLAKAAAYHFNVPELLPQAGDLRIETKGSEEALKKLLAGTTDVAILWEPDVSRALAHPGIIKLLGTEDTEKLIVDVLVVNRKYSEKNPGTVQLLLANYFRALKKYQESPQLLREHVTTETGLPEKAVDSMLKGIKWVNLTQNCEQWFGISPPGGASSDGLVNAVESAVKVLVNTGDFSGNPLPGGDPYRLIYSRYLEDLFLKGVSGFTSPGEGRGVQSVFKQEKTAFRPLTDEEWNRLKEVGTLKVDPVMFQHGSADLDMLGKEVIDNAVQLFTHYPNFRLIIKGHTGTKGDPSENERLSLERADSVARYMSVTHAIDSNRMRAIGLGGTAPLPKKDDESSRSWQYRLPRVELVLVREDY
ncbi:MAG: phosphate ABC transporter substrate-binding/OmpA family protein [Pseudomonadota bacterium]